MRQVPSQNTATSRSDTEQPSWEPTVFLVDDEAPVRRLLEMLIRPLGYPCLGFEDGATFLEAYQFDWPGCVLLDARMPKIDGLEVQSSLGELPYSPPVIMISGASDVPLAVEAMKRGAVDFLKKPFSRSRLHEAIENALQLDARRRREFQRRRRLRDRLNELTDKETAVLDLLLEGLLNKQIAARLDVSIRTIESRRASVLRKMEVDSVAQLIRMVYAGRRQSP